MMTNRLGPRAASSLLSVLGSASRVAAVLFVLLLAVGTAHAQQAAADGPAEADVPLLSDPLSESELVAALTEAPPPVRLEARERLRDDAESARELLRAAVTADPPPPDRWRLLHLFTEFGTAEDIPLLLEIHHQSESPREREVALGAARALYTPGGTPPDLSFAVQEFFFLRTEPPRSYEVEGAGGYRLSARSFSHLHVSDVPVTAIRALMPLRDKAFADRDALADAVRDALPGDGRRRLREVVMATAERIAPKRLVSGELRVRVTNPLQRPLLMVLSFDVWYGDAPEPPGARYAYLQPGESRRVTVPVRLVAPVPEGDAAPRVRVDLRVREMAHPPMPLSQKLYVSL